MRRRLSPREIERALKRLGGDVPADVPVKVFQVRDEWPDADTGGSGEPTLYRTDPPEGWP